jgi:hypothetical protein
MRRRFPQPVRVGDLIELRVLNDHHVTIGFVRHVVRTPQGTQGEMALRTEPPPPSIFLTAKTIGADAALAANAKTGANAAIVRPPALVVDSFLGPAVDGERLAGCFGSHTGPPSRRSFQMSWLLCWPEVALHGLRAYTRALDIG